MRPGWCLRDRQIILFVTGMWRDHVCEDGAEQDDSKNPEAGPHQPGLQDHAEKPPGASNGPLSDISFINSVSAPAYRALGHNGDCTARL
jgi:hypothetical protein